MKDNLKPIKREQNSSLSLKNKMSRRNVGIFLFYRHPTEYGVFAALELPGGMGSGGCVSMREGSVGFVYFSSFSSVFRRVVCIICIFRRV